MKLISNFNMTITACCHECGADLPCEEKDSSARNGEVQLCVRVGLCEDCIEDAKAEARKEEK